jgi:hypothetical protein
MYILDLKGPLFPDGLTSAWRRERGFSIQKRREVGREHPKIVKNIEFIRKMGGSSKDSTPQQRSLLGNIWVRFSNSLECPQSSNFVLPRAPYSYHLFFTPAFSFYSSEILKSKIGNVHIH